MRRFTSIPVMILSSPVVISLAPTPTVYYRNGNDSDKLAIAKKSLENPLTLSGDRFVVALDENENRIGWAQIRPLGTARTDPSTYDSRPGSYDVERDVDDAMWDALEQEEDTIVPNGFSSLPWTPEYRAFANAAKARRERRQKMVEREQRLSEQNGIWELATVYVEPKHRALGIGTELVKRVMRRHVLAGRDASNVYLLSPALTVGWFRHVFGFELIPESDVPAKMELQMNLGNFVSKVIKAEEKQVCCMRGADCRDNQLA